MDKHNDCTVLTSQHHLLWLDKKTCPECSALTERDNWREACYYTSGLASPYVAPNQHPEQLAIEAYQRAKDKST